MTSDLIAADIEFAVWKWAKGNTNISAAVDGQIHFDIPGKTPPFPLITIRRIGGGPLTLEALIDDGAIQFSCWGKPNDKATTARVAAVVTTEAFNLYRSPVTVEAQGASVTLHGAQTGGALWLPDPETGNAQHVVDAVFTTTSTAAA